MKMSRRIAFFTPLPPLRTGTADYGAALVAELEKQAALSVYQKPPRDFNPGRFDHIVYQIGNNPFHSDIYKLALECPGVVVLHEASVHYLVRSQTLSRGDEKAYLREVRFEIFGSDARQHGERYFPLDVPQPHEFFMLRRLLRNSRACIVHSRYAERLVRLKGFQGPIGVIPHGATARTLDPKPFRAALGIGLGEPLIGVFGYQRPDKQIGDCLSMFKELSADFPDAHLLILGQEHPLVALADAITDRGLNGRVLVRGYQTIEDFDGLLAASTVVLNLRATTFGETSGTMMRAFGLGRPVVASNVGSVNELPDDVCLKIPRDRYEMEVLRECTRWLLRNPAEAKSIGAQARDWSERECAWPKVAAKYVTFLEREVAVTPRMKPGLTPPPSRSAPPSIETINQYLKRWIDAHSPAGRYFDLHSVRLPRTVQLVPMGDRSSRILELGCYMQITPALRGLLAYGEVCGAYLGSAGGSQRSSVTSIDGEEFCCTVHLFNCEIDRYPYPDEYFDAVTCCELLEHLEKDPMHMMIEIHRILKPNGALVLTTPNAVSIRAMKAIWDGVHPNLFSKYVMPTPLNVDARHAREYTPNELLRLFPDAGFSIEYMDSTPYGPRSPNFKWATRAIGLLKPWTRLREDCLYVVGRKSHPLGSRFPSWLYEPV